MLYSSKDSGFQATTLLSSDVARLGSKSQAWARLERAQALKHRERAGSGPGLDSEGTHNEHRRNVLKSQLYNNLLTIQVPTGYNVSTH
jgi:hypothetical protein